MLLARLNALNTCVLFVCVHVCVRRDSFMRLLLHIPPTPGRRFLHNEAVTHFETASSFASSVIVGR